jgi:hypothetical protein
LKIDFSTIFLVIFLVLPGLFSRRSRNSIVPRSLEAHGETEELADFVVQGVVVHLILGAIAAFLLGLVGAIVHHQIGYYYWTLDRGDMSSWSKVHSTETTVLFGAYVAISFLAGHILGWLLGKWRWSRRVVPSFLKDLPIIYRVLAPRVAEDHSLSIVFVEAEMKDKAGFYSGQIADYAQAKDGEPHKIIYLIEVWFKQDREAAYSKVDAEGIMIDLADVATLKVDQVSRASLLKDQEEPQNDLEQQESV